MFSWAWLEPRPGEYDFGLAGRVIELLHAGGIAVDLATATASPPPWLARRHPESLPVPRTAPGCGRAAGRRSARARRSTASGRWQLVGRWPSGTAGTRPLALWHVGNESGNHVARVLLRRSARAFRDWLAARYGDLDALNAAWGTAFWSQRYGDWAEVLPPRATPTFPNPTQQLDFAPVLLRRAARPVPGRARRAAPATPGVPVTTNFMVGFRRDDGLLVLGAASWTWSSRTTTWTRRTREAHVERRWSPT